MSGVTPALACSSSDICRCVVEAGWMIRVFASPILARMAHEGRRFDELHARF